MAREGQNYPIKITVTDQDGFQGVLGRVAQAMDAVERKHRSGSDAANDHADNFRAAVREMAGDIAQLDGPLGSLTSRLGTLPGIGGRATAAIGAIGAAVGALSLGISSSLKALQPYEAALDRLEAVAGRAGSTVGLTTEALAELAGEISILTGQAETDVLRAISGLAATGVTFEKDFIRVMRLAGDMTRLTGGQIDNEAQRIAEALADPASAVEGLREGFAYLSPAVEASIKSMVEMGRTADAQQLILQELEKAIGGTSAAGGEGLEGATNRMAAAWDRLKRSMADRLGIDSAATGLRNLTANLLDGAANLLGSPGTSSAVEANLEELRRKATQLQAQIAADAEIAARAGNGATGAPDDLTQALAATNAEIARLEAERAQVVAREREAADRAERNRAEMFTAFLRGELDKQMQAERQAVATRAELLEEERATAIASLRARAEAVPGADQDALQAAIDATNRRYDAEIAQIKETRAAQRDANAELVQELKAELAARSSVAVGLDDAGRALAQHNAMQRLGKDATAEQRAEVSRLAGELFDLEQAHRAATSAEREANRERAKTKDLLADLRRELAASGGTELERFIAEAQNRAGSNASRTDLDEIAQLATRQFLTGRARALNDEADPTRAIAEHMGELDRMFADGMISANVWSDGIRNAFRQSLEASEDFSDGGQLALLRIEDSLKFGAAEMADGLVDVWSDAKDALADFVVTGKLNLSDFVNHALRSFAQMGINRMFGLLGAGLFANGAAFAGGGVVPFAAGGVVDRPTMFPMRGGRTGLMGEAGPEGILPLKRMADGGLGVQASGGGGATVNVGGVHVTVQGSSNNDPMSAARMGQQIGNAATAQIKEILMREKMPGGILYRGY